MRGIGICQWVAGIFILALAGPAWAQEKNVLLASKDANQAVIVIASESNPGTIIAATRLQEYVTEVTGHRPDLWTDSEVRLEDLKQPVVILAGELPANRWTADILRQVPPADSEEGFSIQTLSYPQRTFIVVRGADSSGVRYGLHHLVEALEVDRAGTIRFPRMKITRVPLVKHRLLGLFWNGGIPLEEARQKNPENWPLEKLHQYLDLMDSFGYNGLQTWDNLAGNYRGSGFSFTRAQWRNKLIDILARNHQRDWKNLLFVWSNAVLDPITHKETILQDFTKEENLRTIGEYYDYQASLAPYLDYFISHNQDPGGGKNFTDVQMLHLMLRSRFAKQNPLVRPAFSYWFMFDPSDWWGWKGPMEEGALKLLDMKMMPRDSIQVVGVHGARPETWHQVEVLRGFHARGYDTGIWAWYWADFEYQPGLHVHASRLQKYFDTLPRDIARNLTFHTIDSHNYELNLASLYVASQMLWNPDQKADDLVKKYCECVYGPNLGPTISGALLEVDRIRCHEPVSPGYCGAGTRDPKADLENSRRWIQKLKELRPDNNWVPKFKTLNSLQTQIEDIRCAFEEIRDFAQFRLAVEEVRKLVKDRNITKDQLNRMVEKLPTISRYVIEYYRWQQLIDQVKEEIASR